MNNIVCDTPETINAFALLALKGRLKMESVGMKCRGASALSIVKQRFGIKARTAKDALPLYEAKLREMGILCTPA